MSLDGLRAWIGVVERKLAMRTRVFLILVAIAVGGAGAAIYLAVEAKDDSVSKSDLQQVRDELTGTTSAPATGDNSQLEAEISALQEEVAALQAEGGGGGASSKGGSGGSGGAAEEATGGVAPGSSGGAVGAPENQKQLEELVEKAKDEADQK